MILTTNGGIFVAAVFTVGISVALPGVVYAAAVGFALELELPAFERALSFVTLVTAIIDSVANRHARRTISVRALEHAWPANPVRTARRFVRTVLAILFSVAPAYNFYRNSSINYLLR